MMKSTDPEKRTRDLFANSRLTLDDPEFASRVMQQVEAESLSSLNRRYYLKWFFIILTSELLIGLLLWSLGSHISHWEVLPYAVLNTLDAALSWLVAYQYFFLPFVVLFLLKALMDARSGATAK